MAVYDILPDVTSCIAISLDDLTWDIPAVRNPRFERQALPEADKQNLPERNRRSAESGREGDGPLRIAWPSKAVVHQEREFLTFNGPNLWGHARHGTFKNS